MFRMLHSLRRFRMLVFDHLTRRVALLHDGPEDERQSLRQEVIRLLRGAIPKR